MKKSGFLNKLTIIDILIIICIIGAVGFAIFHMVDDDSTRATATSFDSSTKNKIIETYLTDFQEGKIVTSTVTGTNSSTGEKVKLNGKVLWLGEIENEKLNILLENNGKKILAGFYNDAPNADIYIEQISLETSGDNYNITDFQIAPKEIKNLNDLISKMPNNTEYEISTTLAMDDLDSVKYQKLINALSNNKRPSISVENDKVNSLKINRADKTDLTIANHVLGDFKGQTSQIEIRIYNATPDDSIAIQSAFNVLNVDKIS